MRRTIYALAMLALAITALPACSSLQRLDYVCVDVDSAGALTGTRAKGKGVKLPDGETLTPELARTLCGTE